jgi:ribosomal protein S28E/S33
VAGALIEREELVVGVLGLIESDGEMDEVEVKVVEAELRKAVIQRVGNVLGAVL